MKIAITSHGEARHSQVDSRFGRADYFIIYDRLADTYDCLPNTQNLEASHGAGKLTTIDVPGASHNK